MQELSEEVSNEIKKNFIAFETQDKYYIVFKDGTVETDEGENLDIKQLVKILQPHPVMKLQEFLLTHNIELKYNAQTRDSRINAFIPIPLDARTIRIYKEKDVGREVTILDPEANTEKVITDMQVAELFNMKIEAAESHLANFQAALKNVREAQK